MSKTVLLLINGMLGCILLCQAQTNSPKVALSTFDYRNVTIDDGPLRHEADEVRDYYLSIPNDDLLKGFRKRAGLPSPGAPLGGWYSADIFHIFGQILSGLSRMYAATGDAACREKVDYLIHEWGKTIDRDGFFFYSPKPNAEHYTFDKMCCGLVDAHRYAGNSEALQLLDRITTWAEQNLQRNDLEKIGPKEPYTLTENLYRAYQLTGQSRYREFGKVWEYSAYWNLFSDNKDIFSEPVREFYHAYSHVNALSGAAEAYRITGQKRYLETLKNGHDYIRKWQVYATGGFGPDERFLPENELNERLPRTVRHFEVQCGSWAVFKLCKSLLAFTGDARYGDWIEQIAINGIGSSIPSAPNGGVHYYADYHPAGGSKQLVHPWACCAGTRPQAAADFYDLVYFKTEHSLYVNLFTPSTVQWNRPEGAVTLSQKTAFPEEETVAFELKLQKPSTFELKIRRPSWVATEIQCQLNGNPFPAEVDTHGWISLQRKWCDGDRVVLKLPMKFEICRMPAGTTNQFPVSIKRGPVAMAFRAPVNPASKIDFLNLEKCLEPSGGDRLSWRLRGHQDMLLRPYFAFKQGERYFLLLDPKAGTRIDHHDMSYSHGWEDRGNAHFSNQPHATVESNFEGTGVRLLGSSAPDGGRFEIRIDNQLVDTISFSGANHMARFSWEKQGLAPGKHLLKATVLPVTPGKPGAKAVRISGLEVFQ